MQSHRSAFDRGALVGAALAGVFGTAWSLWAASGLAGTTAVAVRVAGVTIGLVIIIILASMRGRRSAAREPAAGGSGSMFSSVGYRITVAVEVVALIGGDVMLNSTGHQRYTIVWVAVVVGVHFLPFARLFWSGFYWLGTALLAAAASGALVGVTGGGAHRILPYPGSSLPPVCSLPARRRFCQLVPTQRRFIDRPSVSGDGRGACIPWWL